MGYLRNADLLMQFFKINYGISVSKGIFKKFDTHLVQWSGWDCGFNHQFIGTNFGFNTQFKNFWSLWSSFDYNHSGVENGMLRGGPAFRYPSSYSVDLGINSNETKKITVSINGSINRSKYNYSNNSRIGFSLSYRPIDRLSLNFNSGYNKSTRKLQYLTNFELDKDYYIMSSIDQNTVDFTFRFDFNITPDLTIQYYGAPFVSAASYYDYKDILNPLANNFEDRYQLYNSTQLNSTDNSFDFDQNGEIDLVLGSPNFNFQQFRSNLVFRWEYIPGSVLFLVWAHEQTDIIGIGEFDFANNFSNLFKVTPADRFLIKFQYRFT